MTLARYCPIAILRESSIPTGRYISGRTDIRKTFEHVNDRHSLRSVGHVGFPPINVAISRIHRTRLLSN